MKACKWLTQVVSSTNTYISKFYGKVGVLSWILFHLIWKNYFLYWDFDLKSWIVDYFTREKTPQNNFSNQNISVENNYFLIRQFENEFAHEHLTIVVMYFAIGKKCLVCKNPSIEHFNIDDNFFLEVRPQ